MPNRSVYTNLGGQQRVVKLREISNAHFDSNDYLLHPTGTAVSDFAGEEPDDISFSAGDHIQVCVLLLTRACGRAWESLSLAGAHF